MDLCRVILVIFGTKFMIYLFTIQGTKLAFFVDILVTFIKLVVDAVSLVIVILEGDNLVLVNKHGILNLCKSEREINFISVFVSFELLLKVDTFAAQIWNIIGLINCDSLGCLGLRLVFIILFNFIFTGLLFLNFVSLLNLLKIIPFLELLVKIIKRCH